MAIRGRPFQLGNPGKQPGTKCGRSKAVAALDKFLSEEGTLETLVESWRDQLESNPERLWLKTILPLLPKEMLLKLQGGERIGRGVVEAVREIINSQEKPPDEPPRTDA